MYAYFIDDWVYQDRRRVLDKLELLLTQHGVSGRKIRLARLSNINADLQECVRSGIKSIVAVGDDATASRVLNHCFLFQKKEKFSFAFGVIPVKEPGEIAKLFGVPALHTAVSALVSAQTRKLDVGTLNQRHYFLTAAVFPKQCALMFRSYTVSSLYKDHHISICNTDIYHTNKHSGRFNPCDGTLEAVIAYRPQVSFWDKIRGRATAREYIPESFFPIKKIQIKSKQKTLSMFADTEKQLTTPIEAEVLPGALEAICAPGIKK